MCHAGVPVAADVSGSASDEMGPISGINVTPFVDVVLVLLVIFMVTAPALMKDVMGIQLPKASSGDQKAVQSLGIAVTRQGQILVNGQLSGDSVVQEKVQELMRSDPDAQVIISADTEAMHGDVVKAVDLVKSAGASRFALQIERK